MGIAAAPGDARWAPPCCRLPPTERPNPEAVASVPRWPATNRVVHGGQPGLTGTLCFTWNILCRYGTPPAGAVAGRGITCRRARLPVAPAERGAPSSHSADGPPIPRRGVVRCRAGAPADGVDRQLSRALTRSDTAVGALSLSTPGPSSPPDTPDSGLQETPIPGFGFPLDPLLAAGPSYSAHRRSRVAAAPAIRDRAMRQVPGAGWPRRRPRRGGGHAAEASPTWQTRLPAPPAGPPAGPPVGAVYRTRLPLPSIAITERRTPDVRSRSRPGHTMAQPERARHRETANPSGQHHRFTDAHTRPPSLQAVRPISSARGDHPPATNPRRSPTPADHTKPPPAGGPTISYQGRRTRTTAEPSVEPPYGQAAHRPVRAKWPSRRNPTDRWSSALRLSTSAGSASMLAPQLLHTRYQRGRSTNRHTAAP